MERLKAYGFTTEAAAADSYYMHIVSERAHPILVARAGDSVRAETKIAGHRAYLRRIFVNTRRSMLVPTAESAELYGEDAVTGEPCYEKVGARE